MATKPSAPIAPSVVESEEQSASSSANAQTQKLYLKPSELARKLRDVERQIAEELERSEKYQANLRRLRTDISKHDQQLRDVQLKLDVLRGVDRQHGDGFDEEEAALLEEHDSIDAESEANVAKQAVQDGVNEQLDHFMRTPFNKAETEDKYQRIMDQGR